MVQKHIPATTCANLQHKNQYKNNRNINRQDSTRFGRAQTALKECAPRPWALLALDVVIGRLLVSHARTRRQRATHDPHHEKVADRRGSLGNSLAADRNIVSMFCVFLVSRPFCSLNAAPVNGQGMEK